MKLIDLLGLIDDEQYFSVCGLEGGYIGTITKEEYYADLYSKVVNNWGSREVVKILGCNTCLRYTTPKPDGCIHIMVEGDLKDGKIHKN